MNLKIEYKNILPHLAAIIGFIIILAVYFSPVLENKTLRQHDIIMAKAMQQEIKTHLHETGELSLWTNAIFSGMPTYQVWVKYPNNFATYVMKYIKLRLGEPMGYVFVYFICFYILMLVFGAGPILAFIGGLAFAFSSYNFINIEAGHLTKALAVGFMPLVLAGVILALKKKYIGGMTLAAIALATEIRANHLQITYYLMIMLLILFIVEFIDVVKKKGYLDFVKSMSALAVALVLAVGINITALWTTNEYTKYTMRGGSEITAKQVDGGGLEKDYALRWSYGVKESFTLLIPYFSGGASGEELGPESSLAKAGVPKKSLQAVPTYWGSMTSTSGPIYIGAIMLFLFVMGMFIVKHRYKWWLFATAVLALMLAWGSNFMFLTDLFFNNFPLYNKFRVPMTLLLIVGLAVPILSSLAVKEFLNKESNKDDLLKALKYSFYGVGGITLLIALFGGNIFDFTSVNDTRFEEGGWPMDLIREDRARLMRMDAFRSFVLITIAAGTLFAYLKNKIKLNVVFAILGIAILFDFWGVDKRYFNKDDFHRKSRNQKEFVAMTAADQAVLQDSDPHYRVMDLTTDPWNSATKAYYHKLVGGYHGAKMARYQDMIEYHLSPELQALIAELQKGGNVPFEKTPCLNMLNTKYYIAGDQANGVIQNPNNFGNAWFIQDVKMVANADEEINMLRNVDLKSVAVVDEVFKNQVKDFTKNSDDKASIDLVSYAPNKISYKTSATSEQIAVFSEVYYDKGWNAYLDKKLVPHFRANYILRAMNIPAGEHEIEFKFEPKSYIAGEKISLASSVLMGILILFTIYTYMKPTDEDIMVEEEKIEEK
ncbi:MAG: YfhO family protein [Bacteroidetes bacterium]|nr:YfhO family protein [Bacteroidota bacterium]